MKILLYSHSKDIDGLGSVILGKICFDNLEYKLFPSPKELNDQVIEDLKTNKYSSYDRIYITDLTLPAPAINLVNDSRYKNKIIVFDHHFSAIENGYHLYDFTNIKVSDDNGVLTCGTKLFYEYLLDNLLIERTPVLDDFTEKIRLEDTWDWKKAGNIGLFAHDLAILHSKIGNDSFIAEMLSNIKNSTNELEIPVKDQEIIKQAKDENELVLKSLLNDMEYFIDDNDNFLGVVFAEHKYVNDLAQKIRDLNNPFNIQYIVVISLESNSKSYRSIDFQKFNVAQIALNHGGGGQFGASGVGITPDQKNKVLSLLNYSKRNALKYIINCRYKV